jgi:hypothetical protein
MGLRQWARLGQSGSTLMRKLNRAFGKPKHGRNCLPVLRRSPDLAKAFASPVGDQPLLHCREEAPGYAMAQALRFVSQFEKNPVQQSI